LKRTVVLFVVLGLLCGSAAMAQTAAGKAPAQPGRDLANGIAQRLSEQLHANTVVGEPVKAGLVTLIPILMVEVNFAGGSVPAPAANAQGIDGFLMSGEARPLGFVAITAKGTRFIPVGNAPGK
jgi:uncharacterized spore protein YtfJ